MATYPLVNGIKHDWSSVEIDIDGQIYVGVTELTYSHSLEPGAAHGTSAQKLARTRGEYSAEGSLAMHMEDAHELIAALGNGYMERVFNITAMYQEPVSSAVVTDRLIGCRITSTDGGGSQGPDPLSMTMALDIMRLDLNGVDPLADMMK